MSERIRANQNALPSQRGSMFSPWWFWALVVAIFLLSGWYSLDQSGPIALSPSSIEDTLYLAAVIAIPFATIGAIIAARQPWNSFGWTLLGIAALAGIGQLVSAYGHSPHPLNLEAAAFLVGAGEISWMLLFQASIALVPLIFPDGHAPGPRWAWLYGVIAIAMGSVLIAAIAEGWKERDTIAAGATTLPDPSGFPLNMLLVALVATIVATIGAFASLVARYRAAGPIERDQLKWFIFGLSIVVATVVLEQTVVPPSLERIVWFATWALPISMAIGILRYRLFDIDLIVSRTVLWGLLTAFVFGVYIIIVGVIGSRLSRSHDLALSLIATGIVAVCFQTVRQRLQTTVNQFVYGDRDDPYAVLARLGRRLELISSPDELLPAIVESVAQALKLPYAAISLQTDAYLAPVVAFGSMPDRGELLRRPLTYNTEPVGELILAPRTPGEELAVSDLRLIDDLARQIGVAAHAVLLTADLQRSREQLVIAREEERRRIRNDLHDGLGPVLSGLKLRAETARNLVGDNPQVDALLADIADRTETAVADIRRLVYSLRPPSLDELGLGTALAELGNQADLPVTLDLPDPMPAFSAAVEVAVYRITQEALTNVSRHAGARSCRIAMTADAQSLTLEITDDGNGLSSDSRAGVGLRSMRERVSELGGSMTVESAPEMGTTLIVRLPTDAAPGAGGPTNAG